MHKLKHTEGSKNDMKTLQIKTNTGAYNTKGTAFFQTEDGTEYSIDIKRV